MKWISNEMSTKTTCLVINQISISNFRGFFPLICKQERGMEQRREGVLILQSVFSVYSIRLASMKKFAFNTEFVILIIRAMH